MHSDPFRAALWCVLIIGTVAFLAHLREDDRREESTSIEVTTTTATHTVRSAPSESEETPAAYVGNVNTHKFHRITCRYATCPNCTTKFPTRDDAIVAGYRPGGCCDP